MRYYSGYPLHGFFSKIIIFIVFCLSLQPQLVAAKTKPNAIDSLKKILNKNDRNYSAQLMLGSLLYKKGKVKESAWHFKEAVELKPTSIRTRFMLAKAYKSLKHYSDAANTYRIIINQDPYQLDAYNGIAECYLHLKKYNLASTASYNALSLDTNSASAYLFYGRAKIQQGKYREGLRSMTKSLQLNPKNALAYKYLGDAFLKMENYQDAVKSYQKHIKFPSAKPSAFYRLGLIHVKLNQKKDALTVYKRLKILHPKLSKKLLHRIEIM